MLDVIKFITAIWPIVATIASLLAAGMFLVARNKFVSKEEHAKHQEATEAQNKEVINRLVEVEKKLERMPSDRHVSELGRQIEELKGETKTLNSELGGVHRILARLEKPIDMIMKAEMERNR